MKKKYKTCKSEGTFRKQGMEPSQISAKKVIHLEGGGGGRRGKGYSPGKRKEKRSGKKWVRVSKKNLEGGGAPTSKCTAQASQRMRPGESQKGVRRRGTTKRKSAFGDIGCPGKIDSCAAGGPKLAHRDQKKN